ncbi:hypothetical protein [Planctomicrobium piriforme]|uniref:Uncharacterized protein n=1 Tax=Planctomicrobium piriforme TaxID=1576369 RepID=A0A1I3G4G7_9PLAN|nr:hypothetical protein [Planctomicrobium piriforme]SFI18324.1 hypothetical protein SAMN05421753_106176 [Planctomicrobium piriforme]
MAVRQRRDEVAVSSIQNLQQVLSLLCRANGYARELHVDRWQFAVDYDELLDAGASRTDLRWLVASRMVDHALETTAPGSDKRSFSPLVSTQLPLETSFVLSDIGLARCGLLAEESIAPASHPDRHLTDPADAAATIQQSTSEKPVNGSPTPRVVPEWDPHRRELRYQDKLVKRFRVPAAIQELVLNVFQEEGWPDFIDDPLPPVRHLDAKRRLQATVKSLNRSQLVPLLRFHGNGCGRIVCWEPLTDVM